MIVVCGSFMLTFGFLSVLHVIVITSFLSFSVAFLVSTFIGSRIVH